MSVTRVQERLKADAAKADEMIAAQAQQPTESSVENAVNEPTGGDDAAADQGTPDASVLNDDGGSREEGAESDTGSDELAQMREDLEKERQRYRSLQGMINSRDKQIEQLHELISGLHQAQDQQTQSASSESSDPLLTKDDETAFGADLVDMARRAAREEGNALLQSIRNELNELKGQVQGVSNTAQKFTEQTFESQLNDLTNHKWKKLDSDPRFIEWLQSNRYRHRVFSAAVQEQDAQAVADVFNEFAEQDERQTAAAEEPRQRKKDQLQKQVAPGKSRSTGTAVQDQQGEKQWTHSEITQVYRNKKDYSPEDFQRLERDIAKAQRDGRVDFSR